MTGSALDTFTDLMSYTGPTHIRGPREMINEAVKHSYILPRFIEGKGYREMVQGGDTIRDHVFFQENGGYLHYHPNQSFTYDNPQVSTLWTVSWRFTKNEMTWTEHEFGLNLGEMTQEARFQRYKDIRYSKEMNLWTDTMNSMEADKWAVPNKTTMESAGGKVPYSIPCFVNEFADGLPSAAHPGGPWTTVQGIDPTATGKSKWDCQRETYDSLAAQDGTVANHLFSALKKMYHKTRFARLPKFTTYSDPTSVPQFIATSLQGDTNYEGAMHANQDLFVAAGRQDPAYPHSRYRFIDIVYIDALDTAAIFPTGASATLSTELDNAGTANAGPRYYFLNGKYMVQVFHANRFFHRKKPFSPSAQPFTKIMIVDCWNNFIVRSRQRHGIVFPGADITSL